MRRLEKILKESNEMKDLEFATDLYRAFCNNVFYDYKEDDVISFSWRASGRFIAEVRNVGEDYLDFYCSQDEGIIKDNIKKFLYQNGFVLFENFYDMNIVNAPIEDTYKYFKDRCPERIQYLRDINIDKILK